MPAPMPRSTRGVALPLAALAAALTVSGCGLLPGGGTSDADDAAAAADPGPSVEVVDLSTPAQASIAVSSRLFDASPVAVLAGTGGTDDAIDAATELGVPVLIDDPAAPAELARLRATTVLTFGTTKRDVFGGVPAAASPDALADQLDELSEQVDPADAADAIVAMASVDDFQVAAATASIAGGTVVEGAVDDLRSALDDDVAAAVMTRPESDVLALGAPFTPTFSYAVSVLRADAQQIGGGFLALDDRLFVTLHGRPGDPSLGQLLGESTLTESIARMRRIAQERYGSLQDDPVVPTLEIVATAATDEPGPDADYSDPMPVEELTAIVDAADAAGVSVLVDLQPGAASFLAQARVYADVLARPNVGLTLEPGLSRGRVSADDVNAVSTWLADLTAEGALPQKLVVVRDTGAIADRDEIAVDRPELAVTLGVDVPGTVPEKLDAWAAYRADAPAGIGFAWIQYAVDGSGLQVEDYYRRVDPFPSVIIYQ